MRAIRSLALGLALAVGCFSQVLAAEQGSEKEAIALVKKAVAYMKANGKEKAFAEFNNPKGQFVDRDLYITVTDLNGVNLAHGANQKIVGKNVLDLKDADGKAFIREYVEVAKKGGGWVEYKWPNPVTKAVERKKSYVELVDDDVVTCGVYSR